MENNIVLETIRTRRSIRKYIPDQLSDEALLKIVEAGRYAPSGGNNQTSHFIVIQNKNILTKLKNLVEQEFAKMQIQENMYKGKKTTILQSQKGGYDFIYNAPTLVVMANLRGYGNAMADCALAMQNMMLAAVSLEVGSCYINQLHWLDENVVIRSYLRQLGLEENETVCSALALGYAANKKLQPLKRTGNKVVYFK